MLHYLSLCEREYYQSGVPKRDLNFTAIEADQETVSIIARSFVKLAGIGLKALAFSVIPTNKYRLPR